MTVKEINKMIEDLDELTNSSNVTLYPATGSVTMPFDFYTKIQDIVIDRKHRLENLTVNYDKEII